MESGTPNPYRAPEAELAVSKESDAQLPPVPFEDEATYPSLWDRLLATLKLGYTNPFNLADRIPMTDPILPAWTFYLIVQLPFSLLGVLVNVSFQSLLGNLTGMPAQNNLAFQLGGLVGGLLLGVFIAGVIIHGCLWMLGGTRHGLGMAQTIRAMAYGGALLAPVSWIPILGGFISLVWMVLFGIGLARVHRTDTWRGVCALLLPVAAACCVGLVILGAALSMFKRF